MGGIQGRINQFFSGDILMLLLFLGLQLCPKTEVVNLTDSWVELDIQTLNRAKHRCREIYEDAPCLKVFTKKEERVYNATCGEGTRSN